MKYIDDELDELLIDDGLLDELLKKDYENGSDLACCYLEDCNKKTIICNNADRVIKNWNKED